MYIIETKSPIKQLFCKHDYHTGELTNPEMPFMSFQFRGAFPPIISTKEGEKVMSDISGVYCSNCNCEYHEDGDCEYEGSLRLSSKKTSDAYLTRKEVIK